MSLETRILEATKAAMYVRDISTLSTLKILSIEVRLAKMEGEVTPEIELKLLQKVLKQCHEELDNFIKYNSPDGVRFEQERIKVIEQFLPHR